MKIGLTIDHYYQGYGGPFTVISELASYLFKNNVDARIYYNNNEFTNYNLDVGEIVKTRDLFHLHGIWSPLFIKFFYHIKKQKKKVIISTLGATEPWSLSQRKIKKKIAWQLYQRRILNNCDFIHATSELEKNNLLELGITAPIKLLPHGLIIKDIKIEKFEKSKKKKALFFSRIHEKKGILELLYSWSEINPSDWILKIYGPVSDISYMSQIKALIKKLSLENQVYVFDPVYDAGHKQKIFLDSDCFLLPSKSENFGMAIGEALSFGLPVLTTEGTPWKSLQAVNGGIVISFSQKNLTAGLRNLLSKSNDQLLEMGTAGKDYLNKNFNMNFIIKKYISFYEEVLKR